MTAVGIQYRHLGVDRQGPGPWTDDTNRRGGRAPPSRLHFRSAGPPGFRVRPRSSVAYEYQVVILENGLAVTSFRSSVMTPALDVWLGQNHPNPFNPETTIRFTLDVDTHVALFIYDAKGRHVSTLVDETRSAGPHEVRWDGTDEAGSWVSSGVYFYRMKAGNVSLSRRMVLLK